MKLVNINVGKAKPRVKSLRHYLVEGCSIELYVPRLINEHFYCKNVTSVYDEKNRSAWLVRCIVKVNDAFHDSYVYASNNFLNAYVSSMDVQFKDMVAVTANLVEGAVVYSQSSYTHFVDEALDFLKNLDYDYEDIIYKVFTFNAKPFKVLTDSIIGIGATISMLFSDDETATWVNNYRHTVPVMERIDYYLKNKGYDYNAETVASLIPEASRYYGLANAIEVAVKVLSE